MCLLQKTKWSDKYGTFFAFAYDTSFEILGIDIYYNDIAQGGWKIKIDYHRVLHIFQKLEISKLDVIFKIHTHISLDQENKAKL